MMVLTHREVLARMRSGATDIVETLPIHEYRAAHISGAIHLPLNRLWQDAPAMLTTARPVVVYCRDSL